MARRRPPGRLASVLRIRKLQEDIAAGARARAERDVAVEEARFAQRQADLRHPWTDRAVVELAYQAAGRAAAALREAAALADDRRAEHIAAVQRARAIERLVGRRRAEVARDEQRRSAATLDDLATTRHVQRRAQ
jgi:hypothetical protein